MFMCLSHLLFWKESTDWHCRESFKSPLCILPQRGFKMDPATNNGTQHTDQTGPSGSWGFRPVPSLWWLRTANHAALGQCSTRWKSSLKVCLHIFIVWWHFPVVVLHSFYRNWQKGSYFFTLTTAAKDKHHRTVQCPYCFVRSELSHLVWTAC